RDQLEEVGLGGPGLDLRLVDVVGVDLDDLDALHHVQVDEPFVECPDPHGALRLVQGSVRRRPAWTDDTRQARRSSLSRMPSAMNWNDSEAAARKRPGPTAAHGWRVRNARDSWSTLPQLGVGSGTPRPR